MRRVYADLSTSNVPPEVVHYFAHVGVPATFYVDLVGCCLEYSFDFLTADPSKRSQYVKSFEAFFRENQLVQLGQSQMTGGACCAICTSSTSGGVWRVNVEEKTPLVTLINTSFENFERTMVGLVDVPFALDWWLDASAKVVETFGPSDEWPALVDCVRDMRAHNPLAEPATWLFSFEYRFAVKDELPVFERFERANWYVRPEDSETPT